MLKANITTKEILINEIKSVLTKESGNDFYEEIANFIIQRDMRRLRPLIKIREKGMFIARLDPKVTYDFLVDHSNSLASAIFKHLKDIPWRKHSRLKVRQRL